MAKNLVIVESPAKAATIEKFLGKDYLVTSSYGHVRDLDKKNNGVEINKDFKPNYIIPDDKKGIIKELKKLADKAEVIWLATDEDREGEAISWHLKETLKLGEKNVKRILFNEITKPAILKAIENPRNIDENLVEAQQARRILDRLVGFELSPLLWRKVRPSLSAGRVQSVAVRLIVERERDIDKFKSSASFRITGDFSVKLPGGTSTTLSAELNEKFSSEKEALEFLNRCVSAQFTVEGVEKKPFKKSPSAPFTTSTLQQEASRKLRFSVAKTMLVAQRLYEAGKITYMRTDSVNLSETAISASKKQILADYGKEYSQTRKYKTKSASAQEAHEAIRPTYFENETISGSKDEAALYELIWKRAIASQMSDAQLERTTAKLKISNSPLKFTAKGEVIKFDGFLKVYLESSDEENGEKEGGGILPPLSAGQELEMLEIAATEKFTRPPARYTEASLVKRLEELGIGRPSTYAPTISTIQKRGYVIKEDRIGYEREYKYIVLRKNQKVSVESKTEVTGSEKSKLFPSDIAMLVSDFLIKYFPQILDYKFTAYVESELDDIAKGSLDWQHMLKEFYFPFHDKIQHTFENSDKVSGERVLGIDPKTKRQVSVRMARYGPVAMISDPDNEEVKPEFAGLRPGQKLETINLEEALDLFKLPRTLGEYEDENVTVSIGRFGPYVKHINKFYSLPKDLDPYTVGLEEAIGVIEAKRKKDSDTILKQFDEDAKFKILKGKWGPYLKVGRKNVALPKGTDISTLTYDDCVQLADKPAAARTAKKRKKK